MAEEHRLRPYSISGGTEIINPNNGNEINLFHSFEKFGLTDTETATFEHSPGVTNIIGRVTGGDPSNIDGQISVGLNSSANLYLLNPSGILFGNNASLNLGGSFSASTATGIAFGDALFDALADNVPNNTLIGNPTGYVFGSEQVSPIVNEGNLAVQPGQSLTLLGGQAINSGTLSAPTGETEEGQILEGQILVAAVPGENLVRVSQLGSLLSLEFETVPDTFAQSLAGFTPSTLPELLTGPASVATDLILNPDGSLSLSGSPFVAELGTAVLDGTLDSSNTTIFIERTIVLNPDLSAPDVTVEAIQALELADLLIPRNLTSILFNSSGPTNIGTILSSGNNVELRSQGAIDIGDITTSVGGDAGLVTLESQSSITTGDIDTSSGDGEPGSVVLDAGTSITTGDITAVGLFESGDVSLTAETASIITGDIDTSSGDGEPGSVVLDAGTSITTGDITAAAFMVSGDTGDVEPGNVDLIAGTSIVTGKIDTSSDIGDAGNVVLDPPGEVVFSSIDASSLTGTGGDVTVVSTASTVRGIDVIAGSNNTISTAGVTGNGRIRIIHGGGDTVPFDIGDASFNGTAGAITTGADTLADGDPNEPFFGSFTQGNIELIATDVLGGDGDPTICVQDCTTPDDLEVANAVNGVLAVKATENHESIFLQLEDRLTEEFVEYLRPGLLPSEAAMPDGDVADIGFIEQVELGQSPAVIDLPTAQKNLIEVQRATGKKPALIYAVFGANQATDTENNVINVATSSSDPLELMLITAEGEPVYVRLDVTREEAVSMAQRLRRQVSTPSRANLNQTYYLTAAQQLYQWLVAPLQAQLDAEGIDTISFILDAGLRSTPLAALHDGQDFIIQNYNVGLMPSLSLTDLTYQDISNVGILLAGTSTFADQAALPGVPVELDSIASQWPSTLLRGETFVLDTLKGERQNNPSGIIHLATHGEFNVGDLSKSYLYLHNQKLALTELRSLGLHQPSVELLTLSACQTALGNRSAELGFAGFAVLAGAKTSIASLWNVSDEASAGLMIEFYRQLQDSQPTIKAEALREAQLAMIRGDISVEGGWLKGPTASRQLPVELAIEGQRNFSHPYYWAAFSLVGSPW
ncbi:CHAT domain-containing protein [Leptothoe sp. PORK10 BA2]|uniref:CHAT domain-containing protein n=1 Tax=Leptothoe sp. PORK10 BA2 TaxID=3110254 RepID=UPI002B20FD20|nr:CHAT domain-containing protein [Leptothoe sp. PORK10 BA2]MEA5466646.1 CHAT domain-containing protein [Leptothoe sp. PORK10 BA2]